MALVCYTCFLEHSHKPACARTPHACPRCGALAWFSRRAKGDRPGERSLMQLGEQDRDAADTQASFLRLGEQLRGLDGLTARCRRRQDLNVEGVE